METFFWRRLTELCRERGTTPTAVTKAAGLSTGNVTYWKQGRIPNQKIIATLAEYFGVESGYFVAETEKAPGSEEPRAATQEEINFALFGGEEVSDEAYARVLAFARFVAEEERRRKKEGDQ